MTIWNSTCNPCFSTFDQFFFAFHGLKTGFFVIHWSLILFVTQINFIPMTTVCGTGETYVFAAKKQTLIYRIMLYRIHLAWVGFKLTILVVICPDCLRTGCCKSNYHMITTITALEINIKDWTVKTVNILSCQI